MKMFAILLLPMALLVQHQGCDLSGGADSIRTQFQAQLTPYFRNATVEVNSKDEAILGFTCNTDAGPKLIEQAQDMLAHSDGIARLRSLDKWGTAMGTQVYRTVAIGFSDTVVTLDIASNKISQTPATEDYRRRFQAACHPSLPDVSIYVAYYRITPPHPVNGRPSFVVFDTVGLWSDAEWPQHRDDEISARRDMIVKQYGNQFPGATVEFIASEKVAAPEWLGRRAEQEERASASSIMSQP
ncbi:MAG TPA: hypothetical protein VE998_09860 [Terriglobales bacterium]|nr:hypothetical protein [Terriglobales bacterium]